MLYIVVCKMADLIRNLKDLVGIEICTPIRRKEAAAMIW